MRLCMISWRRSNVSPTENGLGLLTMPSTEGSVPDIFGSFMFLTFLLYSRRRASLPHSSYHASSPLYNSHLLSARQCTISSCVFLRSFVRKDHAQGVIDQSEAAHAVLVPFIRVFVHALCHDDYPFLLIGLYPTLQTLLPRQGISDVPS